MNFSLKRGFTKELLNILQPHCVSYTFNPNWIEISVAMARPIKNRYLFLCIVLPSFEIREPNTNSVEDAAVMLRLMASHSSREVD